MFGSGLLCVCYFAFATWRYLLRVLYPAILAEGRQRQPRLLVHPDCDSLADNAGPGCRTPIAAIAAVVAIVTHKEKILQEKYKYSNLVLIVFAHSKKQLFYCVRYFYLPKYKCVYKYIRK